MKKLTDGHIRVPKSYNYIAAFLTMTCPRGCSYCINRYSDFRLPKILSGKIWVRGLNRFNTNLPITIHGGEPFCHPDFINIINGIKSELAIDLLTTLPFEVDEFVSNVNPDKFKRNLPYPAIRVTFHPETMNFEDTLRKVLLLKNNGFDVGFYLIGHPKNLKLIHNFCQKVIQNGLSCYIKPFLGFWKGKLYGQYKYVGACEGRTKSFARCRTTLLLINPEGYIFKCHHDLYEGDITKAVGHILDSNLTLPEEFRYCDNFGFCNPCSVQMKFDRFGNWGYCAVKIQKDGIVINDDIVPETWGPFTIRCNLQEFKGVIV